MKSLINIPTDLKELMIEVKKLNSKKLVMTTGTFDLLHTGHILYLQAARKCGQNLLVGIDSDRLVSAYKGEKRPIQDENERALIVAQLKNVDLVYIADNWSSVIRAICPPVFVISNSTCNINERREKQALEDCVHEIIELEPMSKRHTSDIIKKIKTLYC